MASTDAVDERGDTAAMADVAPPAFGLFHAASPLCSDVKTMAAPGNSS
jgi:hypothetical protein